MANHTWALKITDKSGTVYASIPKFRVDRLRWELNNWGSADFTVPVRGTSVSAIRLLEREVQIWRDSVLIWWGVPIRAEADGGELHVRCVGLLWYASRAFVGPNEQDFLVNSSFESGLTGWSAVNCTATAQSAIRLRGAQAARLVGSAEGLDSYLEQTFVFNPGGSPGAAILIDLAFWFYIDGSVTWLGPAILERGLYAFNFDLDWEVWEPINNQTETSTWQKLIVTVGVPLGTTSETSVRLYSPGGAIVWDAGSFKVSSHIGGLGDLGTVILTNLVSAGYQGTALNIDYDIAVVGISEDRRYLVEEMPNIWQAMQEWPARNLSDFEILWNGAGTERTFTTWSPRKGSLRSDLAISIGAAGNARTWTWEEDGAETSTGVVMLSSVSGPGPTREFGYAVDASELDGLLLKTVETAPSEATIGVLDDLADAELERRKRPVRVPSVAVAADDYLGDLALGDTVPLTANWGWVQDSGTDYRVVAMELDPATDLLTLVLNLP